MSARISLRNIRQTFLVRDDQDKRRHEFVALDDLNLVVEPGEFLTIVGPSGCGKSTVLDLIAGLSRPVTGTVEIDGTPITGPGLDRSVVFQQYTLLPWRTALANVEFALEARGGLSKAQRAATARRYLALVGLEESAGRLPRELSGGMKQRVAIARSLCYEPGVLLMDEPFGALDAQTRERLQEQLLDIWRRTGTTIVFITHDIEEAVFLGQRVAVMTSRPGRVIETIQVDLDRSRVGETDIRATAEFAEYRHRAWSLLRHQTVPRPVLREVREVA